MRILLIRHGITIYNLEHRYQGWTDIPLCEAGKEALNPKLVWEEWPTCIYVSPLLRARQTAELLFPGIPQEAVEEFREMNFGEFDGHTYEELASHPAYQPWVDGGCLGKCPKGEDRTEYEERILEGFRKVTHSGASHAIIVAHGGTQMALLSRLCPEQYDYYTAQRKPGCGYDLDWDGQMLRVIDTVDFTKGA